MKDNPLSKLTITKTGHRPSQFKKIFDLVTSSTEDFIEALVVFISVEYRKNIANLLELRGSMPCFGNC